MSYELAKEANPWMGALSPGAPCAQQRGQLEATVLGGLQRSPPEYQLAALQTLAFPLFVFLVLLLSAERRGGLAGIRGRCGSGALHYAIPTDAAAAAAAAGGCVAVVGMGMAICLYTAVGRMPLVALAGCGVGVGAAAARVFVALERMATAAVAVAATALLLRVL